MNNDSTTRTKLGDAINSVVAMTEHETDEMIDAVLGVEDDDERPEKLELHHIRDRLEDRIRWANSVVCLIACDPETECAIRNAADAAEAHLSEAQELITSLGRWQHENKPAKPRDLSLGMERHREEHELLKRMLALPRDNQRNVMFCLSSLSVMPAEICAEAMTLIEKDRSLSDVLSFMTLREKGDVCANKEPASVA